MVRKAAESWFPCQTIHSAFNLFNRELGWIWVNHPAVLSFNYEKRKKEREKKWHSDEGYTKEKAGNARKWLIVWSRDLHLHKKSDRRAWKIFMTACAEEYREKNHWYSWNPIQSEQLVFHNQVKSLLYLRGRWLLTMSSK